MGRAGVDVFQHPVLAPVFHDAVTETGQAILHKRPERHTADQERQVGSGPRRAATEDPVHHHENEGGGDGSKQRVNQEHEGTRPVADDLPAKPGGGLEPAPLHARRAHVERRISRASWRARLSWYRRLTCDSTAYPAICATTARISHRSAMNCGVPGRMS